MPKYVRLFEEFNNPEPENNDQLEIDVPEDVHAELTRIGLKPEDLFSHKHKHKWEKNELIKDWRNGPFIELVKGHLQQNAAPETPPPTGDQSQLSMFENQFTNLGEDELGNPIGNCTKCGANGVSVHDHKCHSKHNRPNHHTRPVKDVPRFRDEDDARDSMQDRED